MELSPELEDDEAITAGGRRSGRQRQKTARAVESAEQAQEGRKRVRKA
jgi:hypothetical protein